MKRIPELLTTFKRSLGEVNVNFCAIDATLAKALGQAAKAATPERQLEDWAKELGYYLHFGSVPNLRSPLGTYAIVFLHQVMETFYHDLDAYLKERGAYKKIDPKGSDARPEGEDALRRIVRKLQLIYSGADAMPNYKDESEHAIQTREAHFASTLGRIEALLADYYRLVRNAAVHADAIYPAETLYQERLDHQEEKERIARHYRHQPGSPASISINDMVLYSKILQTVARKLIVLVRPDIRKDVLPYLRDEYTARYRNPVRRRNAIIGALRTDYLLDMDTARVYADASAE